jgi:hypothetical protein
MTLWLLLACAGSPPDLPTTPSSARQPRTLTVAADGSAQHLAITDALALARSGDTIEVGPGIYDGSIRFGGRSVTIRSTGGPAVTTIRANPGTSAVKAEDGEGRGTVVEGFTITGGGGPEDPAVDDEFSSLTLRDDVLTGNVGTNTVYGRSPHLVLERVTVEGNAPSEGVEIRGRRGAIVVSGGLVRCGTSAVGVTDEHGALLVDGATFDCPGATAVAVYHCPGRVQRSVVDGILYVENEGIGGEGTIAEDDVLLSGAVVLASDLQLRNVVSLGPLVSDAGALLVEASVITRAACGLDARDGGTVDVSTTAFWSNADDACGVRSPVGQRGNVQVDPAFVDIAAGDFHLAPGSPLVDAGPDAAGWADPDGSRNDVGAYGGPLSLGGGW